MSGAPAIAPAPPRLRVSHIWQQEVMDDLVVEAGQSVTVGSQPGCTFTTPKLGIPPRFEILRPGSRGYVLTLSAGMGGKVCINGAELPVEEFLRSGGGTPDGSEGSFRASPVGPGDWGVIHLDGPGEHTFFFQFVAEEPPLPPPVWVLGPLLAPALAFAIIFHGILVTMTYLLKDDGHSFLFPGGRDLMTAYLVERPPPDPPVEEVKEKPGEEASAGAEHLEEKVEKPAATRGEKGRAGGEGERRSADPDAGKGRPDAPKVALNTAKNRESMEKVNKLGNLDNDLGDAIANLRRSKSVVGDAGRGRGSGSGVGDDKGGTGTTRGAKKGGSGGGGKAHEDVVTQKDMDTGGERAGKGRGGKKLKERVVVGRGASGDYSGGLSKEDVNKVMKSASGSFKACYQRQVNRRKGLAGTVTLRFTIRDRGGAGRVMRANVVSGSSDLNDKTVEDCILRKVRSLTFPAKGGATVTRYPLVFSQG